MKYPEYIIRYLRRRCGLDETDTRRDKFFQAMAPNKVFSEVLEWNGLLGDWDIHIKRLILDIYGIDLDDYSNPK